MVQDRPGWVEINRSIKAYSPNRQGLRYLDWSVPGLEDHFSTCVRLPKRDDSESKSNEEVNAPLFPKSKTADESGFSFTVLVAGFKNIPSLQRNTGWLGLDVGTGSGAWKCCLPAGRGPAGSSQIQQEGRRDWRADGSGVRGALSVPPSSASQSKFHLAVKSFISFHLAAKRFVLGVTGAGGRGSEVQFVRRLEKPPSRRP